MTFREAYRQNKTRERERNQERVRRMQEERHRAAERGGMSLLMWRIRTFWPLWLFLASVLLLAYSAARMASIPERKSKWEDRGIYDPAMQQVLDEYERQLQRERR